MPKKSQTTKSKTSNTKQPQEMKNKKQPTKSKTSNTKQPQGWKELEEKLLLDEAIFQRKIDNPRQQELITNFKNSFKKLVQCIDEAEPKNELKTLLRCREVIGKFLNDWKFPKCSEQKDSNTIEINHTQEKVPQPLYLEDGQIYGLPISKIKPTVLQDLAINLYWVNESYKGYCKTLDMMQESNESNISKRRQDSIVDCYLRGILGHITYTYFQILYLPNLLNNQKQLSQPKQEPSLPQNKKCQCWCNIIKCLMDCFVSKANNKAHEDINKKPDNQDIDPDTDKTERKLNNNTNKIIFNQKIPHNTEVVSPEQVTIQFNNI